MTYAIRTLAAIVLAMSAAMSVFSHAATDALRLELLLHPHGNFSNNIARPLRYDPDTDGFAIQNGSEYFNRPLYSGHSGFRIDGGDKPEFSLYLPGRGGNLRFGVKTSRGAIWLNDATFIETSYEDGILRYSITDPVLDGGRLTLETAPLNAAEGVIVGIQYFRSDTSPAMPVKIIFAYGGANGARGARGGDIGCEKQPVSEFFQLRPDECRDNLFTIESNRFVLRHNQTTIAGAAPEGTQLALADANKWNSLDSLLASRGTNQTVPVIVGEFDPPVVDSYVALQLLPDGAKSLFSVPEGLIRVLFSEAKSDRMDVANKVAVHSPDKFINSAVPALCVAADAIWDDKQQCFMHGAVAWRARLLGWRGQYAGDDLGWPERTAAHFASFAKQQDTDPIPQTIPPPDEKFNLARSEAAIHSNGNMSKNHYDMNLVAVDAFFRHLLWTGDTNYAREMWPVIERHFAWERRLFRREFGPDKLPLYEGYAAIWASDNLSYDGGGAAHASAYNYFANTMAARVATIIGKDPTPYQKEADLILRAMNKYLWLSDEGNFAESKDLLGLQLVHPNSGLWTFYHTIDSEVPSPMQSWLMTRWIDTHVAHIPITGDGVPDEGLFTLPETSWMPYQWSLNNVVMAEAAHTSLAYWEANRPDEAFKLFKGELSDSMFCGLCPGNLGCMTSHDMARGESQRDFADAIGANSRALVEGLFGIHPDVLAGKLTITPGFPADWPEMSFFHPNAWYKYRCLTNEQTIEDRYDIGQRFPRPLQVALQIMARGASAEVTVDEKPALWNWVTNLYGVQRIEVDFPPAEQEAKVVVRWTGARPKPVIPADPPPTHIESPASFDWTAKVPADSKFETINLTPYFNDQVTQIFRNEYRSPRSPYASLATPIHGIGGWCGPDASFDVNDTGLRKVAAQNSGKIVIPNGIPFATPSDGNAKNIVFTSQWDNYPREVSVPLTGKSSHAFLLMAGSTGPLQSQFDNGEVIVTYTDGSTVILTLRNPTNWWPIDQEYFIDDFAFRRDGPIPPRVNLGTGEIRILDANEFKGKGGKIPGGAATVLELPLDNSKPLKSLTVRALANEVVIGLMAVTLQR